MPTISVIKEDLERLAGQTYDLPELEAALEIAKAEVKVEGNGRLRIQLKDTNRPDLWSSEGIARLLKGYRQGRDPRQREYAAVTLRQASLACNFSLFFLLADAVVVCMLWGRYLGLNIGLLGG